jgi:hypothetical protein
MKKHILSLLVTVGLIGSASAQLATTDTFGTGDNQFSLDFRTIGNAGNAADRTGYGAVGYTYAIGTYSISLKQINNATELGLENVTAGGWSADKNQSAVWISWYAAAAFVNWLNTSTGHQSAYNLAYSNGSYSMDLWHSSDAGYDPRNFYRNKNALYVLPSEDEWYKAAYGKSDGSGYYLYTTASDIPPIPVSSGTNSGTAVYWQDYYHGPSSVYEAGGLSSYGTMGQGGNVWQWLENAYIGSNTNSTESRTIRGGSWYDNSPTALESYRTSFDPSVSYGSGRIGFRVAKIQENLNTVPEPSTYALFGIGALALVIAYRRKVA